MIPWLQNNPWILLLEPNFEVILFIKFNATQCHITMDRSPYTKKTLTTYNRGKQTIEPDFDIEKERKMVDPANPKRSHQQLTQQRGNHLAQGLGEQPVISGNLSPGEVLW